MAIELSSDVEEQLRDLATRQGRQMSALVEEAVRQYLEAGAITDVDSGDVAEAQFGLIKELPNVPRWKAPHA
jgi:predicted transcriptional regulator